MKKQLSSIYLYTHIGLWENFLGIKQMHLPSRNIYGIGTFKQLLQHVHTKKMLQLQMRYLAQEI